MLRPLLAPRSSSWCLSLSLASLAVLGCAGAPAGPPASPDTVIRWAIGSPHRGPEPPGADRLLLALSTRKPGERGEHVTSGCVKATSFLPAPGGDPRIFFLIEGRIHVRNAQREAPAPLARQDPGLGVTSLLAADVAASPLQILVSARPQGSPAEELWILRVDDQSILSQHPASGVSNQDEFFKKYTSPHCLPGGHRCLVVSSDESGSHLDVEPTRGDPPVPFQKFDAVRIFDAAWGSADGEVLYVMTPCS